MTMAAHSLASVSTPPSSPLSTRRSASPASKLLTVTRTVPPSPTTKKPVEKKTRKNLGPGCGLLDWVRLGKSGKDLTGVNGATLSVSEEELAKHCTMDDAWAAIRGVVYNITPYFKFHPGGKEELMEGAGKDCTLLFDEVHSWVKVESMLSKCKVGVLIPRTCPMKVKTRSEVTPSTLTVHHSAQEQTRASTDTRAGTDIRVDEDAQPGDEPAGTKQVSPVSPTRPPLPNVPTLTSGEGGRVEPVVLDLPTVRIRRHSDTNRPNPRMEWQQTLNDVTITIHPQCKNFNMKSTDLILDVNQRTFEAALFINDWVYDLNLALSHGVTSSEVTFSADSLQIRLKKYNDLHWDMLGSYLPGHGSLTLKAKRESRDRMCTVDEVRDVTHDTKLFRLQLSKGSYFKVPVGHHISVRAKLGEAMVSRDYTPVTPLMHPHGEQQSDCLHLMVKLYKDGKMSKYLSELQAGDKVCISDPQGTFDDSRLLAAEKVVMIAAGSGLTPMVGIIRSALRTARSIKLLFANKTEGDIMWREDLDSLAKQGQGFEVFHILSAAGVAWEGIHGRITHGLLREHLPLVPIASQNNKICICVCGPTPFLEYMSNILLEMQYPVECIHLFS